MIGSLLAAGALLAVVLLFRHLTIRRHRRKLLRSPLAGLDTGTRSPYRVPRGVRFHKGF